MITSRGRVARFGKSERGGALVELAVVLPVLVLLAVGVIDYGRVFYRSLMVANAARAGAEWGALDAGHYDDAVGTQNFAKLDAQEISTLKVSSEVICKCGDAAISCSALCGAYGAPRVFVKVTAVDTVDMYLNYPGLPSRIAIRDTAIFRAPQ